MAIDRLPERHRLGHRQAEPLRPVQRHVAVAHTEERVLLFLGVVAVDDPHILPIADRGAQPFELGQAQLAVDALEDEDGPFVGRKGLLERLDQAVRILALDDAQKVEHEEERETLGKPEAGARDAWRSTAAPARATEW